MKVSAFTFIKNGQILGYPFLQSIQSVLPIVEEFVVNVGESEDDTLARIESIPSSKIRIIQSKWNNSMQDSGFVYGQQKMIAQFNCTGDWAFYVEGDEVYHESELKKFGKTYEFHRYAGAGHGFFYYDRAMYRQEQAVDGWQKIFGFFEKYLTK